MGAESDPWTVMLEKLALAPQKNDDPRLRMKVMPGALRVKLLWLLKSTKALPLGAR